MEFIDVIKFLLQLLTGTGIFLIGVHLLTTNIEQLATSRIKKLFSKTANKKIVNVGLGALITAIIQSSGVTTVLIVGFVNVGMMNLFQATAMIMGANIGTTITAQVAALSTFKFTEYIQLFTFIGAMVALLIKNRKAKKICYLIAGLGLIFVGLSLMSRSMENYSGYIQTVFAQITNPFLLFFAGVLLTALVQSSSATTSIVISMSVAGISVGTGGNEVLFFILGTNVGSCVTALMSSIGGNANAKRTSLIHLMFNVFGSLIFFVFLYLYPSFMEDTFHKWFPDAATQIAMFHTFFNLTCTIIFLPFSNLIAKLSQKIIKDKKPKKRNTFLEERILSSPDLALTSLEKEMFLLGDEAIESFLLSFKAFKDKNLDLLDKVNEKIDSSSLISKEITDYIVKLSSRATDIKSEENITNIHKNIGDMMRISEIASNFIKYTHSEVNENLSFSANVIVSLDDMIQSILKMYSLTRRIVLDKDITLINEIDAIEETVDNARKQLVEDHIERLNKGLCNPANSSIYINLVSNIERMGDHITYIAHSRV